MKIISALVLGTTLWVGPQQHVVAFDASPFVPLPFIQHDKAAAVAHDSQIDLVAADFQAAATRLQACVRGFLRRKKFVEVILAVMRIQSYARRWKCEEELRRLRKEAGIHYGVVFVTLTTLVLGLLDAIIAQSTWADFGKSGWSAVS